MGKEYLRLDSKFTSVAAFWKPESPDEVITGTLTVNDDGIRFVTSPEYVRGSKVPRPDLSQWNSDSIPRSDVLHGFFEGEHCTLLDLMEIDHPGLTSYKVEPQSVASTAYRASILVSGMPMISVVWSGPPSAVKFGPLRSSWLGFVDGATEA